MQLFPYTILLLFVVYCSPPVQQLPGCMFEMDFCLGSSLEEIRSKFPKKLLKQRDKTYQYVILDQPNSRNNSSKIDVNRVIYLYLDEQNNLEKFAVSFMYFGLYNDRSNIDYWREAVLAIGKDQLLHYYVDNLDWERPYQYKEPIIVLDGMRIVREFNMSDIELVHIEVSREK